MSNFINNVYTIDSQKPNATYNLSNGIKDLLNQKLIIDNELVIMCIGTDRSTGDCLGPLVGDKLKRIRTLSKIKIMGTLNDPVHAKNIEQRNEEILSMYNNPFIIAIDASLGRGDNIGNINLINGCITPGSGVNKNLKPIGNIGITGIVNISGFMEYIILQNTRLSLVMNMADKIAMALYMAITRLNYNEAINI